MSPSTTRILAAFALGATSLARAEADSPPLPVFSVLARKEIRLDDHTVTYVRVRPPANLPKLPPPPPPRELTPEEQARSEELQAKQHVTLSLSATVYLTAPVVTEIKLRCENREYTCYSNADFRDLRQLSQFEGEDAIYAWFPFIYEATSDDGQLPAGLSLSATEAEYLVQATEAQVAENETVFRGLDLVHAFYEVNKARLRTERLAREAAQRAKEQELRDHPPKKEDTVIYFWKKEGAR